MITRLNKTLVMSQFSKYKNNHKDTKALSITKNLLCAALCLSDFVVQTQNRNSTKT